MENKAPDSYCYRTQWSPPGYQLIVNSSVDSEIPLVSPTRNYAKLGQRFFRCPNWSSGESVPSTLNVSGSIKVEVQTRLNQTLRPLIPS